MRIFSLLKSEKMILHIPQCRLCNKVEGCQYRQDLYSILRPLQPKTVHVSHKCQIFGEVVRVGDRVNISVEVAYLMSDGGHEGDGVIQKELLSGMATVIEKSTKGRMFVVFDDKELAADFAKSQRENKIGFYGQLQKGLYVDEFEELERKGFPFWVWPVNIIDLVPA